MGTLQHEYSGFYIDGGWRPSSSNDAIDVISPSTGERIGGVPAATSEDIDAAVEAARRAFYETEWASRPVHERAELCRNLATAIADRQPELAELFTEEMGCTHFLSDVYQATAPTLHWNYYAAVGEQYEYAEVRESDLSPLAARRRRRHRAVRREKHRRQGAGRRRRGHVRVQLRACLRRAEGRRQRWWPAARSSSRSPSRTRSRSSRWAT